MRKKIEKLVFAGDLIENELERIRIKINKIIEVLNRPTLINYPINPQPQAEEEWYCECGEPANQGEHICKDTPEQKEEWEEKQRSLVEKAQRKYYDFKRQEKFLIDDAEEYKNTRDYVGKELVEDIISLTKSLLLEREVFTKDELFMLKLAINDIHNKGNSAYDEIGEKIKRELDKLNKQEK